MAAKGQTAPIRRNTSLRSCLCWRSQTWPPRLQSRDIGHLAAEQSHVSVHAGHKPSCADNVPIVDDLHLRLIDIAGNVNPSCICSESVIEIFAVQVDCVSLKPQIKKSGDANSQQRDSASQISFAVHPYLWPAISQKDTEDRQEASIYSFLVIPEDRTAKCRRSLR